MIDDKGTPKVLEFNCRFGDPETQPIMMRLQSSLTELCLAGATGKLDQVEARWDERTALGVVMAAGGYPEKYHKGDIIAGIDEANSTDCKVFHAGTQLRGEQVVTHGGRVLCVTALGSSVKEAQDKAYQASSKIQWNNAYFRTDIGYRAIAREH